MEISAREKDVGYVCGVLYAGGVISLNAKYGNYLISFETRKKCLADVFLSYLNTFAIKKAKIRVKKRGDKRGFVVSLYSKPDVEFFKELGLVSNGKKHIPPLCRENDVFRRFFLRGVLDSKATIQVRVSQGKKRVCLRMFSVNLDFLEKIRELFLLEGIKSVVYRSGVCYCLEISGKTRLWLLIGRIGFEDEEKTTKLKKELGYVPVRVHEIV